MKYEQRSFSVAGPINVSDAEWDRIFPPRGPAVVLAEDMKLEDMRHRLTLAEAKGADLEADFERAAADRDAAQAQLAEVRGQLLLAEMKIASLVGVH